MINDDSSVKWRKAPGPQEHSARRGAWRAFDPVTGARLDRRESGGYAGAMKTGHESTPAKDPLIEAYKRDIDRTLIRENLKLTPEQRLEKLHRLQLLAREVRAAGRRLRR